jgi:adenosylcobinamide-phosphate synthase
MWESFYALHGYLFSADRIPASVVALALVSCVGMLAGPVRGMAFPLYWGVVDGIFGRIGGKMDRTDRPGPDLAFRGFILTVVVLAVSYALGRYLDVILSTYGISGVLEGCVLSLLMASGTVWAANKRLFTALSTEKTVKGAFFSIATSTRTDLTAADEFTITRVGMGLLARSFDKAVVGPVLWYLIAGLPAAFLYAGLAALAWRFGKDGFTKGFGATALALEKLMGFVPNMLAGVLLALAGVFTPTGRTTGALKGLLTAGNKGCPYAEGGLPVTAMAYALHVSLGGATQDRGGSAIRRVWVGQAGATAQLSAPHLHRALYLTVLAHILFLLALLGAMIAGGHHLLDFAG